jgi:uncharacterized protein YjbI with pentapeptide repeats
LAAIFLALLTGPLCGSGNATHIAKVGASTHVNENSTVPQDSLQPTDETCAVPAHKDWRHQEKFVWEQACGGKIANLNEAAGCGGELDPKSPWNLPDSRVLSSAFLETILLNEQFSRLLRPLGVRIIGARFNETINLENAEIGHDLWLADCLIERGANLARVRSTRTIAFVHSKVGGTLNLDGLEARNLFMQDHAEFVDVDLRMSRVSDQVALDRSKVSGRLIMNGVQIGHLAMREGEFANVDVSVAHVSGQFELTGSTVTGKLDMRRLHVGGELLMHNAKFTDVDLGAAHISDQLLLAGSKVTGKCNLNGAQAGNLLMPDVEFGEVDLTGMQVRGVLDLTSSKIAAELDARGIQAGYMTISAATLRDVELAGAHVSGGLLLDRSKVTGKLALSAIDVKNLLMRNAEFIDVDLTAARVSNALALTDSKVAGALNMASLQVGDLLMVDAVLADVDLRGGHVSRLLSLIGARVSGPLVMNSLQVGTDLLMYNRAEFSDIALSNACVGGDLSLAGSKVSGTFYCYGLKVAQDLDLSRAAIGGTLDLRGAQISRDLVFSGGDFKQNVNLRGIETGGALRLDTAQWAPSVLLTLRDAKNDRIPDLTDGWAPKLDLNGFTYRVVGAAEQFDAWFRRVEHYVPQPYEQLASIVQNQGDGALAKRIRYFGREAERAKAKKGWRIWLTILRWAIGYGYYPYWALGWAVLLIILGAAILRLSGEGPRNGMPVGLAYSFDMLLPIIKLRELH